ncbi:ubiquitin carboxyl-terminal hydrolase 23 isoform X2 [Ziziphus jujuba]|uniref:Ubiquitin carboxyl-terminal hydrolase n=1 Tax=Ziziphus jujuba TaxID=326968 RepID=A0A6P4ADZ1_ZIZJJ|nr:ubiquitin carboxyl-terminal hydrolase 23 isoform X2 [Ziziphus jujuba]
MAEGMIRITETKVMSDGYSDRMPDSSSNGSSLFQRRIEFHQARKPFRPFSKGDGDFRLETLNPSSSDPRRTGSNLGQSVLGGKKADGSEFLENGLDPELSFGITFRRIGAGLENLGNTCFLNSVLQCLTYTEPLAAYLQSGKHQNSCHVAGFCALCAIQKHVSRALQSTGRILAPKDLVSNLRCISRNFRNARQEDAHEYMVNLLESMHKCCLPSGVPSESPSAYEKSLVHKIFGGRLRSQVKCLQCSSCSNKFDPFLDLSLDIAKADSLQKAFLYFTAAEQLDGGERQYQCQQCKQKVRALKQLTVHKAPYVLTIHLKRFRAHDPGQKIDKKVQFGPTLDLKPFVSGSYEGDLKYTLYGVLVHYGWSTHSGHYYCYVRTSSGMWYSLDDNRVVQVSEKTVLEQKAYMLFYVRDRKNIVSWKPFDIAQKENKVNEIGTKTYSTYNQGLKKPVQNGLVDDRLKNTVSSTTEKKNAFDIGPPRESFSSKVSDCPMSEPSLKASLSKDPSERLSFPPPSLGQCLIPSSSSPSNNNVDASNLEVGTTVNVGSNVNDSNEGGNSNKDFSTLISTSPNCKDLQSFDTAKNVIDETSQKNKPALEDSKMVSSIKSCVTSEKVDPVKSVDQPNYEKVGSITNGPAVGNSIGDKGGDYSKKLMHDELEKSSDSSVVKNEALHVEDFECRSRKKLKKKISKSQVASFHSSILFRASLGLRKKKKLKRSKHRNLDTKNLKKELLMEPRCFPSDLGPSTSEKTHTDCLVSSCSHRKKPKSGSKKEANGAGMIDEGNSLGDSLVNFVDGELGERIAQNNTVLASDKQLDSSSRFSFSVKKSNARGNGISQDCSREKMQNGWMGVLTRVARWDGIELPSQTVESSAMESVSIGYIGDEWDEEYDRGKRKKVRESKHIFGGQNPFQEIATKKMKLKQAKVDRYSSGNRPFRI